MNDTLADIRAQCNNISEQGAEYDEKMMHTVPDTDVVDKVEFLREQCRDKIVLSLGCTGPYQEIVDEVAAKCYGVDKDPQERDYFECLDLDAHSGMFAYFYPDVELIWLGEILEHLTNPGHLLQGLGNYRCPILITVPSAFSRTAARWMGKGIENVNRDHVAYYSYWTLLRLIEKCGYKLKEWYWYDGNPLFAEGLIFIVEAADE